MSNNCILIALFCGLIFGNLFSFGLATSSPPTTEATIIATGASFPTGAYKALSFAFSKEVPQYRIPLTSTRGRCRLIQNCPPTDDAQPHHPDWISVTAPLPNIDYEQAPDIRLLPSFAGAVVPIYNLGQGINNLVLSLPVLAKMFRQCAPDATCEPGWITYWNDSEILALNPHIPESIFHEAGQIIPVIWADKAGTTETFKKTLAANEAGFATQMAGQISDSTVWPNANVVRANTNRGVSSRVLATPSSIGYVSLDEAKASGLPHAALGQSFIQPLGQLRATADSVMAALMEKGLDYGNNGDPESRLTSDAFNAKGSEAWPLVQFTYFGLRNDSLRLGATCEQRTAVMTWFEWFYSAESASDIMSHLGFAPLPRPARQRILQILRDSFRCEGELVYREGLLNSDGSDSNATIIEVIPVEELFQAFDLYSASFGTRESEMQMELTLHKTGTTTRRGVSAIDRQAASQVDTDDFLLLPLSAVPWGVIYNLCDARLPVPCDPNTVAKADLVLTVENIADILAGRITTFNDTRILVAQEDTIKRGALPEATFQVFVPPVDERAFQNFLELLRVRGFNVPATLPSSFIQVPNLRAAQSYVAATTNSLTFASLNVFADASVFKYAKMRHATIPSSPVLVPNETSIHACFAGDEETKREFLNNGVWKAEGCWPLVEPYFLSLPAKFSDEECYTGAPQEIVGFAEFILSDQQPLEELGMTGIDSDEAIEQLNEITCFGRSILSPQVDSQYLPMAIVILVRVFGALVAIVLVYFIGWTIYKRQATGAMFLFYLQTNIGSLLQLLAVFPLTIQDGEPTDPKVLDASCMATPWLYFLGVAVVFAPLLAKSWRVRKIFFNPKLRVYKKESTWTFQMVFFAPLILILTLWTVLDPYHWVRETTLLDPSTGSVAQTAGRCTSNNIAAFMVPIVLYLAAWLVLGIGLAMSNRKASGQFILVRNLSIATLVLSQALVIGVPVLLLVYDMPVASFVVMIVFVFFTCFMTCVLLFVPFYAITNGWKWFSSSSNSEASKEGSKDTNINHNNRALVSSNRVIIEPSSKEDLREVTSNIHTASRLE